MKDGILQFTLRRLQAVLYSPRFWAVMLMAALVLGIAGPFDTLHSMALMPRLAYWLAIALSTFLAGYAAIGVMIHYVLGDIGTRPVRLVIAGLAAGVPVTAIVRLFNHLLFAEPLGTPADILGFYINCSLISAAVSLIFGLAEISPGGKRTEAAPVAEPQPATAGERGVRPAILDRLPANLRGKLLYMSMQDHYVDVHTDKGNTLVLMRLADAIAETRGVDGIQVHRSHWVSRAAIAAAERRDGKLFLTTTDGAALPVSRSYMAAVREAGLG